MAKFAKAKPLPNENEKCLKDTFAFVEETKKLKEEQINTPKKETNKKGGFDE